jgi:hypothetical protein
MLGYLHTSSNSNNNPNEISPKLPYGAAAADANANADADADAINADDVSAKIFDQFSARKKKDRDDTYKDKT